MRFYGAGGILVPVRWYFCSRSAPVLGLDTIFASSVWEQDDFLTEFPCAEVGRLVNESWSSGSFPDCTFINGIVGSSVDWLEGFAGEPVPPLPCFVEGIPTIAVIHS
jgi:hypothetical protein